VVKEMADEFFSPDALAASKWSKTDGDRVLSRMLKEQGFDAKPAIVNQQAVSDAIENGDFILFRGVEGKVGAADRHASALEFIEQFKSGDLYAGMGAHGNGTYSAYATTIQDGRGIATAYSGGRADQVMVMILPKDARIISGEALQAAQSKAKESLVKMHKVVDTLAGDPSEEGEIAYREMRDQTAAMEYIVGDEGRFASALGYDAIELEHMGQMVVLNRGAVSVMGDAASALNDGIFKALGKWALKREGGTLFW